ncbi:hypothetical protein FA95DRAFT_1638988 [Auriscalpium vulgare]|uniref:Uncharacterized protein n=1 Tax=Auriscalpium vulgare TaxID=40419 RepID=A0ACB8RD47_9AGAM|nr:hypothetical protein FA95DRAFT_1638988 [Auriscalpium vulgare]
MSDGLSYCWDREAFPVIPSPLIEGNGRTLDPYPLEVVTSFIRDADTPEIHALLSRALTAHDFTADFNFNSLEDTPDERELLRMRMDCTAVEVPGTGQKKYYTVLAAINIELKWERYKMDVYGDAPPLGEIVLEFVRRTIAKPSAPCKPMIPAAMLFPTEFAPYHRALAPFLDTLPFEWHMAGLLPVPPKSPDSDCDAASTAFDRTFAHAAAAKQRGNLAYAANDRVRALAAYTEAEDWLHEAICLANTERGDEGRACALLAIATANRAAVYLRGGSEDDAEKALRDGTVAVKADPGYAKGYLRQARALVLLGYFRQARAILERGREQVAPKDVPLIEDLLAQLPASK